MLVLTRKLQEKITIAGNITVTVLRVKGQTVRIGIEAPRDVRVVRGELPMKATEDTPASPEADLEETVPSAPAAASGNGNAARLPQRRKFDRYAQPPLRQAISMATALAK